MSIRYTPGQFRYALGLTKETFRYWKKYLPNLAVEAGHSPCFGPGELLATAIAKRAADASGVSISKLAPAASELFGLCEQKAWPQLEALFAVLFLESGRALLADKSSIALGKEPILVVPLTPIIAELRERLLAAAVDAQSNFAFPPMALATGRNS